MLIRRLRQEAARQNWLGVALDLMILILGVFLGMQVNNWNAARLDENKGRVYRERLAADFEANLKDLDNRRLYYTVTRDHAQAALDALDRPVSDNPAKFLVDAYQASQIAPRKLRRFTYDEVISTGHVEILGDAKLRSRLANYYTDAATMEVTFDNIPPYREHLRLVMPARAQRAVRNGCKEVVNLDDEGASSSTLTENCTINVEPSQALEDAAAVRTIPTLRADLTRLIADKDVKLELLNSLRNHLVLMKAQIAAVD
jgi:hypothetical protein